MGETGSVQSTLFTNLEMLNIMDGQQLYDIQIIQNHAAPPTPVPEVVALREVMALREVVALFGKRWPLVNL
jgi:hypothetical protein